MTVVPCAPGHDPLPARLHSGAFETPTKDRGLAALAFLGMIGGVSPYAAIGAVVVFYCLDPISRSESRT
jgi:hypothetical protein